MVRITENQMEPSENGRGQMNYLWEKAFCAKTNYLIAINSLTHLQYYVYGQKCDFLVSSIAPTSQRLKSIDLTLPWIYDFQALLIPASSVSANTDAVIKPFQWPVT